MSTVIERQHEEKATILEDGPTLPAIFHTSPFINKAQYAAVREGLTLEAVVQQGAAKLPAEYNQFLRVWINDVEIARDQWATTRVKAGQNVYIRVVPGKGVKDVFKMIALIAVAVVAFYYAPVLVGATAAGAAGWASLGLAGTLLATGVMTAINVVAFLALNALIPPPRLGGNNQDDPSFDLTSTSNQFSPFGNIPRIFGKRRLFPLMAARPYSELQGDDEYLRMALVVGWGPLKIENIKIGETPITAFKNVEYEVREGWSSDTDLTLFTRTVTEENLSIRLEPFASTGYYPGGYGYAGEYYTYNPQTEAYGPFSAETSNSWVERNTATNAIEFSVDLGFPQGLFFFDNKGNKKQATVVFEVQYRPAAGGTWVNAAWDNSQDDGFGTSGQITVRAADSSALRRSGRVKLPSAGQYTVRVRRITANGGDKYVDVSYWTCLRTIRPDYPVLQKNVALIAIRMKASNQLNGVPQTISCEATSYLPVWSGSSWSYQLTSNPAWAYADLLRRRGGETLLTDDRIDLVGIKEWADACGATAANAAEPRWTFDDVLEGSSIFDNMRRVASNSRAFPTVRDGKHSIVRDIQQTVPVQHITPRNSWGYSGSKAFIDYPHAMRVTFFNKNMGYQRDERVVYYDGYTAANATKFETLDLQGCTSATQAFREARYHMAVARLRPEEHSVQMDIEALRCTVGDLVRFSHDAIGVGIAATRVQGFTLDGLSRVVTITFDDDLYFEAGKSYVIRARQDAGTSVLLSINNPGEGYANTVTLTTPTVTASAPAVGDLAIFGEATKESAPMIIKKIEPSEDFVCTVYMVDAADAVHTADTGTIPAFNTLLSLPSEPSATDVPKVFISAVRSDDSVVITNPDGSLSYRILTQLQQPEASTARVDHFEVQYRIQNSSAWQTAPIERANGFGYITGVEVGAVYELRSRAVPVEGQPSDWSTSVTHTVVGKVGGPNQPTGLTATAIPGGIDLAWTNPTNDDFWQVDILENTSATLGTATKVAETSSNKYSRLGLTSANGPRFYWIKSLNTSGVEASVVGPVSATALNRVLLATLSNEAVTLPANAAGVVSDFAPAEGQLTVTDGPTDVLASATLSTAAVGCTATINTATGTPVAGKPRGYYRVTAMSAETATFTITATYNGQSVDKVFSVAKARTGAPGNNASVLTLSSSAQTFTYDGGGNASPASQSITFSANLQNLAGPVTFDATGYSAAGASLGAITLTGTGNSRSLSLANFGASAYVVVTASASGFSDTTTVVRLQAGAPGAPGAQPITGFLTNEATTLAATLNGTVSDFAPAGGTFKVFEGITDRTTSANFSVTGTPTNCTVAINATTGVYSVSAMTADTAFATLRATFGTVTIDKVLSLSKSRQGANGDPGASASVLTLTSTSQTMTFDGSGNLSPASQTITFTANLQNLTGTLTFAAAAYNSSGTFLSNITLDGTGNTRTLTNALFTGNAGTAYVVVTATVGVFSDTTTVVRLQAGAPASQPITGFLTNEAATLAAATNGTVSDFAPAGGTFKVFEGITDRTGSPTYTVQSSSNATVSITAAGVYSVTAMSADTATATLRAVFGGVTIDKVLNLSKSRQGAPGNNASVLTLASTAQAITFDGLGAASPASQTISFTANLQNLSGTADFTATAYTSANGNLGTITLGGTTNTRTLTNALFTTYANTAYVTVSATLSGFTDSITVVRLQAGGKGDPGNDAVVGFLTNEAVTLAADNGGAVSDFAPAGGTFKVFQGLTDRTTGANTAYTVSSSSGATVAINATTGVYSVSAMSADTATATLQAVYSGVTIQKVLSLAKSKTGGGGAPGAAAISGYVTNEAIQIFAYADGTVTSYTGASGSFRVFSGNTDISSSFTLATGVSGNPQNLTVGYTNQSYSISGGFDANEDVASLTIRASGTGVYTGITLDKVVSLSKAKGGYEIVSALPTTNNFAGRVVFLTTDNKLYRYVGAPTNAFTAAVPAADVSGVLTNSEISATKVTGSVGGGNLLANSSFKNFTGTINVDGSLPSFWGVYNNAGVSNTTRVIAGGPFGVNYVRLTANASTVQTFGIYGNVSLGQYPNIWQPGQMYMLSFYARAGNASVVGKFMNALNSNMGFVSGVAISNPPLQETVWQRYVWLASPANNATTPTSEFYISLQEGTAGPPAVITIPAGGIIEIAAPQVEQGQIVSGYSTRADEILPNAITAVEIANSAIGSTKIADGAVETAKIANAAIAAAKLADGAVGSTKLADSAVTSAKINDAAIATAKIADNAITTVKINDAAITAGKIVDGAIGEVKIASSAISTVKIADGAIATAKIADGAIGEVKIASSAVTTAKIADGAIAVAKIGDGAVSTAKIADAAIAEAKLASSAVTGVKIADAAVAEAKLASEAVTGAKIAASAVTAAKIAADAVTADKIAANSVTAGKIAANSVTASKLAIVAAGMALNRDPQMSTDAWQLGIGGSNVLATNTQFTNTTQNDGPVGTSVLQYSGGSAADWTSEMIPLDLTKTYRISLWARQAGASKHYITAAFFNAAGAAISGGGTGFSTPTYHYWGRLNQAFPTTWTLYSVVFGPGLPFTAPPTAKFVRLGMLQNYGSTATDTVYMADYRIEEVLPSTLIQDGAITTDKLTANAVTAAKIAANTITASQIAAGTITTTQIAADTIVAGNIAAGAITASEIATNAVEADKINANAITAGKIATGAVEADKIAANAITAGKIATNAVEADKINANAVTAGKIATGAVEADKIAANAITAGKIATNAVEADKINANAVTAGKIATGAVEADKIAANAITAGKIATNAVEADKINANAVTAAKIAVNAVEADKIASNAVTADKIAANAITAGKIAAGSIATNALVVTGRGAAINDDPLCQDPTAWKDGGHGTTATRVTISDAPSGDSAYRSNAGTAGVSNSGSSGIETSKLYPVSSQKRYRFTAFVRSVSATGVAYLRLIDQVGNQIFLSNLEGFSVPSTWTRYSGIYQPSASVKSVRLRAILNWTGTTGYHEVTDFRLEEMAEADLIVDGAIVANKIAAGAIVASKLAIGDTSNMYPDPDFVDASAYSTTNGTFSFVATDDPVASRNYLYTGTTYDEFVTIPRGVPVEPGKFYYFSCSAFTSSGGDAWCYISWQSMNSAGAQSEITITTVVNGTSGALTKGAVVAQAPANARRAVMVFRNRGTGGQSARFGGPIIRRAMEGELVVDGTITAGKIAANSITADQIAANAITASELAANAVEADKISANAVTAGKIAANAVEADKIAANAVVADKIAANAITAGKIATGAVEADKIAANAVTAGKIAAGAVTTSKLLVVSPGAALNADPAFADPTAWGSYSGPTPLFSTVTDGRVGSTVARSTGAGVQSWFTEERRIPIDPSKTYRVRAWIRTSSGSFSTAYMGVSLYTEAGSIISGDGSMWYYAASGIVPGTEWTEYVGTFGAGVRDFPANARTMAPLAILSYGGGTSIHEIQDLRIEEVLPATLIKDGAITAAKVAASAITADKIETGAITAAKIAANTITADKMSVSSLSAITANVGTMTAGVIRNTSDTYRVDVTNGRTIVQTGGYMKVTGSPFGSSNQFIEWYGPYFANLSSCTEANAIYHLKTNGSAYFGGSLSAGILRTAIQTSSLSGPVLNVETGAFGSNGNSISVILSYYAFSQQTASYAATSAGLSSWNSAVSSWGASSSGGYVDATKSISANATINLNRSIGGSAFSTATTLSITGGTEYLNGTAPTPGDAPGSLMFQRTFQGSLTYTDPSLSTSNRNYQASLTVRDSGILLYSSNQQQRIGIQTTE